MGCGIYAIRNKKTGQIYIGSSVNIKSRLGVHKSCLRGGYHDNIHLQRSWNKHGENAFVFETLTSCNEDKLFDLENYFMEAYEAHKQGGYNMGLTNEFRRNTYNEEVKIKLSKYNLKKNGNINKFRLMNINSGFRIAFDNLVDAANYLLENEYAKGKNRNVRIKLSEALRQKPISNGSSKSIRKTIYKHNFELLN